MRAHLDYRRAVVFLTLLYAGVILLINALKPGTERFHINFDSSHQLVASLFAAASGVVCTFMLRKRSRHLARAWVPIGLAALAFMFFQGFHSYHAFTGRTVPPAFGLVDATHPGTCLLLVAGIILLFDWMRIANRTRLLLDSVLAASSIGILIWYFVVSALLARPAVPFPERWFHLAYLLADILAVICTIMLFKVRRLNARLRRPFMLLAVGILFLALTDALHLFYVLPNIQPASGWFAFAISMGWLLVGYASLLPLWWPDREEQDWPGGSRVADQMPDTTGVFRLIAPYLAVMLSYSLVIMHDLRSDGHIDLNVLFAGIALIFLIVLRQVLALRENQHLTTQFRSFSADLERAIVRRTKQLSALLQLTKAVNSTLLVDQVIAMALANAKQALQADAVVILVRGESRTGESAPLNVAAHAGLEDHTDLLNYIERLPATDCAQILPLPTNLHEAQPLMGSYLRTPLKWQQETVGMIGVIRWSGTFGGSEPTMLESIGVEVGTAMENARRYAIAVEAADRDALTGLYNHRAIHQRLEHAFQQAIRQQHPLTVIMLDIDNFKRFNDTYGHPIGDQILQRVAQLLQAECREQDILGRYGGDEFLIVMPDADSQAALQLTRHLRDRMIYLGFRQKGDQRTIPIRLSFGLAAYPADSKDRHALLALADTNLYAAKLSQEGIQSTTKTQRVNRHIRTEGMFAVLDNLITAVDNKDRYTRRHSEDVAEYTLWLGQELGLSEATLRVIRIGCLLHDVGKIGIPDDILYKPDHLTPEEYDVMKRHPAIGALIVRALPNMEDIEDIVRSHHERWDGTGYPDGLAGEQIPLWGRMVALADTFSALTTTRPYRQRFTWPEALAEIGRHAGTQFDPVLARRFIEAVRKRTPAPIPGHTSQESPVHPYPPPLLDPTRDVNDFGVTKEAGD